MSAQLQAIRDLYDKAQAEAEKDGAVPEGIATIDAQRILYEQWAREQEILVEAASPRAA